MIINLLRGTLRDSLSRNITQSVKLGFKRYHYPKLSFRIRWWTVIWCPLGIFSLHDLFCNIAFQKSIGPLEKPSWVNVFIEGKRILSHYNEQHAHSQSSVLSFVTSGSNLQRIFIKQCISLQSSFRIIYFRTHK